SGSRSVREDQGEMAHHGGRRGHQDRTQPRRRGLDHRADLVAALLLELVRELTNQEAVLGDEPDERDQPDLAVDIERRQSQERKEQRPGEGQRHGADENDEGVAEALELGREYEVNKDGRQRERAEKVAPFGAQLPRFAGIVDGESLTGRQ